MSDFTVKNERRSAAKAASPATYRQGRANRAAFAWKGAFGNDVARVYNDCVLGTTGVSRQVKKGAEDYDAGEDYDG